MPGQRARPAVAADHRSVHPNFPGVPWWGAVLVAATATAVGFAFDAGTGDRELSFVFSACYVAGCILAVLAVRQAAVFTAVIQPPLILFVSVPTAYFLFHSGEIAGLKDLAINCGYPLIERFPLMFFTSAVVLLIGMARWYLGMSSRRAARAASTKDTKDTKVAKTTKAKRVAGGLVSTVTAKLAAAGDDQDDDEAEPEEAPRRKRAPADRPRRARTAAGEAALEAREARAPRKPAKKAAPSRSRHTRPPDTEIIEPVVDRPRRPRPARSAETPPVEPRRRSGNQSAREPRRKPPVERRSAYDRPERTERPERRRRLDDYDPPESRGTNGSSTHHPVSRVRYRGADDGESRTEYRSRPRRRHSWDAWEHDS